MQLLVSYLRGEVCDVGLPQKVTGHFNFFHIIEQGRIPGIAAVFPVLFLENNRAVRYKITRMNERTNPLSWHLNVPFFYVGDISGFIGRCVSVRYIPRSV
jgi:hypothetical protein